MNPKNNNGPISPNSNVATGLATRATRDGTHFVRGMFGREKLEKRKTIFPFRFKNFPGKNDETN